MICYEIFRKCFPGLSMSEETFNELTEIDKCTVFTMKTGGEIVGFSMVKENEIRLICVLPECQRQGMGRALLTIAEGAASNYGDEALAGSPRSRLFIGVPEEAVGFFERFGYRFGGTVAEMSGDTALLKEAEFEPREDIRFEFCKIDEKLINAVREVEEDWAKYFECGDEVFCAVYSGGGGGGIASFCIVEEDVTCLLSNGRDKVGSIGCVGTVPKFRRRGIGLKMVSLAAEELKKRRCDKIFIHYTHVYDWYARLGFESFLRLRMGAKNLPDYYPPYADID